MLFSETLLQHKTEQLEALEKQYEGSSKKAEDDQFKIRYLTEERDNAVQEAKRYQESYRVQESLNKAFHIKDAESQKSILSLTKQLGEFKCQV